MSDNWKATQPMNNDQLNDAIYRLDESSDQSKPVPYLGWFWRQVDFDGTPTIGIAPDHEAKQTFVGFMENNKWEYMQFSLSRAQATHVRGLLQRVVSAPDAARPALLTELRQFLRDCCPHPEWLTYESASQNEREYDDFLSAG
jgi:hypothetical protein